jgi:putative aminopeptidase FrvX
MSLGLPYRAVATQALRADVSEALRSWQSLDAPTGHERLATDVITAAMPGWQRDAVGNLSRTVGRGTPRRVVACAIDRPGFAVTQITADGFLRVHRVGGGGHPLFDQSHEGQQVNVHTSRGVVPGVFAVANGHFAQQHRADTLVATADDLWLDIGVRSAAEAQALGVRLIDPVTRRVPAWVYAGGVAGNAAGQRAGCAAVAAASRGAVAQGETTFLITAQSVFGWNGLSGAVARLGKIDELSVVVRGAATRTVRWVRASSGNTNGVDAVIFRASGHDSIRHIGSAVRFAGTLVETIALDESERTLDAVIEAAGVTASSLPTDRWVTLAAPKTPAARPADAVSATSALLKQLADIPGVSTYEVLVRDAVRAALPAWAREAATVDEAGNLIVAAGPERDTLVVIAHLDEVGYDVVSIDQNGMVQLRARGGTVASAWEGQTAMLHYPPDAAGNVRPPLQGVFVPRDSARTRRPTRMQAWFGLDAEGLKAAGVTVGATVTSYKDAVRLAGTRFTARSLDDRAGSTALIEAVRATTPATLKRRVLFVWSTGEEIGLVGATALAQRIGRNVKRVHSIDTFVSSDTPLESPHFAFTVFGGGPVLRAVETSSMVPPAVRAEIEQIARTAGIPLQVGLTQGGTDGTAFTYWGAPNVPLSWTGRYSHSPAEVLDLRDVQRLGQLIAAIVRQ